MLRLVSQPLPLFGLCIVVLSTPACGEGTAQDPFDHGAASGADGDADVDTQTSNSDAGGPVTIPSQVDLAVDAQGKHSTDMVGFQGEWSTNASAGSSIALRFEDGAVCLSGQASQILDGDYATYFGAEATFTLCQDDTGTVNPAANCISRDAARQFVGLRFTLDNAGSEPLPSLVVVRFQEAESDAQTSILLSQEGEATTFFKRATNPFDPSILAPEPGRIESVTVRTFGSADGPVPFDYCLNDFKALFGDEWEAALIPDWLDEPGPGKQVDYVGVNLVGAEFGESNLPGTYGSDYTYPSETDVAVYADRGMNVIRLPFRWERMQQGLYADLDETELSYLRGSVDAAKARGMLVILDPHNFARYTEEGEEKLIGVDIEPDTFADFWGKLAAQFSNDDQVWFGLMNEPHDMETETWLEAANLAIAAIRNTGAQNLVLVPGNQWTGAHAWFASYYGTPNADVMAGVEDPDDNFAFEFHQYFDANFSGTSNTCTSETVGVDAVAPVTDWLLENDYRGFLGEFGGSDDPTCLGAMENLLNHVGEHSDVWLGWTVWAASPWSIQLNVRPLPSGEDTLPMRVLLRHVDAP